MPLPREFFMQLPEMPDSQLSQMLTHAEDYFPEALQAARNELQRRNVPPERVAELEAIGEARRVAKESEREHEKEVRENSSPPQKAKTLSVRYVEKGQKFAGFVGLAGALIYVMSPSNPNRGNLLNLKQDVILGTAVLGCSLIGSGIGYALGKKAEKK